MTQGDLRRPKAIVDFVLSKASITLSKNQYEKIIGLLNYFSDYRANVTVSILDIYLIFSTQNINLMMIRIQKKNLKFGGNM